MAVARSIEADEDVDARDEEEARPWTAGAVIEAMRAWRRRFPGAES